MVCTGLPWPFLFSVQIVGVQDKVHSSDPIDRQMCSPYTLPFTPKDSFKMTRAHPPTHPWIPPPSSQISEKPTPNVCFDGKPVSVVHNKINVDCLDSYEVDQEEFVTIFKSCINHSDAPNLVWPRKQGWRNSDSNRKYDTVMLHVGNLTHGTNIEGLKHPSYHSFVCHHITHACIRMYAIFFGRERVSALSVLMVFTTFINYYFQFANTKYLAAKNLTLLLKLSPNHSSFRM